MNHKIFNVRTAMTPLILVCSLLTGCASIIDGTTQVVSVETKYKNEPVSGAKCELNNSKGVFYVTTPNTVAVHRAYGDLTVKCEKANFDAREISVKSSTKGIVYGNIILGGAIGAGIDIGNGAAFDYPKLITVMLDENPNAVTPTVFQNANQTIQSNVTLDANATAELRRNNTDHAASHPRVGRIYVYRNSSIFGGRYTPEITINNEKIAVSTSGSYVFVNKKPGQYNVSFDGNEKDPLTVVVAAGESQYVQASVSKGLLEDHLKLALVPQNQGEDALAKLQYVGKAPLRTLAAQNEAEEALAQEDIQKVEFRLGRSSYVVGEMAKQNGCFSNTDAALITEQGAVEIYRMNCGNGKAFMARCELRQCVQMKH